MGIQDRRMPEAAYALGALAKATKLDDDGVRVGGLMGDYETVFF